MSISMYSASVPVFTAMLGNLSHFLDKAQAFVGQKQCDPVALTQYRLAPDMLPFMRQIQIACDAAKNAVARLSGVAAPRYEDTEAKEITFPVGREATRTMAGEAYLKHYALPNMFFHVTTAYAILRHNGVALGKTDYLMGAQAGA
jgi:hypothetical protein